MWVLYDFKTSQRVGNMSFLSEKSQDEFDCQEQLYRFLYSTWFERNMGDGPVVHILSDPGKWHPVAPETVAAAFLKIACKAVNQRSESIRLASSSFTTGSCFND
jgi:hypothetical protein